MLQGVLDGVAGVLNFLASTLPGFTVDNTKLGDALKFLEPKLLLANMIFPIQETVVVLGILCAFSVAMIAFWGIQRVINLLRGAG